MSKHLVLVLTEPTEGNEEAFNEYYEHTHLDEVLASAGYDTAQRFKLGDEAEAEAQLEAAEKLHVPIGGGATPDWSDRMMAELALTEARELMGIQP